MLGFSLLLISLKISIKSSFNKEKNSMDYLTSNQNTLVWFCFTVYTITALFLVPSMAKPNSQAITVDNSPEQELQFASRLILRLALIFPMLILLKNSF